MPTVFISYSHDSEEHAARVLALSNRLRQDGLDCILDQYVGAPDEGWPAWMDRNIKAADKVVMICTTTYYNRVMGTEPPGTGRGVKWEGNLIYNHIYHADTKNTKFIPVLFQDGKVEYIPTPLQGSTFYRVDSPEGYESLYWRLTDQYKAEQPTVGQIRKRPDKKPVELFGPASGTQSAGASVASQPTPQPATPAKSNKTIKQQIVDVLMTIPGIGQLNTQQALIKGAELDPELENQVHVGMPAAQFVQLLVSNAQAFGRLADNRHALAAILQAAQASLNKDNRAICEALIAQL